MGLRRVLIRAVAPLEGSSASSGPPARLPMVICWPQAVRAPAGERSGVAVSGGGVNGAGRS
jgi:hypothetical protein